MNTRSVEASGAPSIALAWGIWRSVCLDAGGGGLPSWGILPASRELALRNPLINDLSSEYYRRIDALSDEQENDRG